MNQKPGNENSDAPPPFASEISTAVGHGKNYAILVGLVALGLLLATVILKSKRQKEKHGSTIQPATGMTGPTFIQPSRIPPIIRPVASTQEVPKRIVLPTSHFSTEADAVVEIRRKSPMVIFNKAVLSATPGLPTLAGLPNSSNGLPASVNVPLPAGFAPTVAARAHAGQMGDRTYIMEQGKLIDAVLESAINSDHPGMLRALISEDIYGDSGDVVLLPRGSRLIGEYDAGVIRGQDRIFVLWQRAIRPDGIDIQLMSAGTDSLGRTGIEGRVDNHFWAMFGAASLLSLIGAGAANLGVHASDNANSIAAYREGVAKSFSEAGNNVLGDFVRIKPTIMVDQGERIKVFVSRDLYFDAGILNQNQAQLIPFQ